MVLLAVEQEVAQVRDQYLEVAVPDLNAWRKQIQTLDSFFAGNEAKSQAMRWLTRLRLLEAVPFQYLVPAEEMLPTETIRFFHIDRNWVDALIDGAMSVTLTSTREKQWLYKDDDGETRYTSIMNDLDTAENLADAYRNFVTMQSNASTATKQIGGRLTGFCSGVPLFEISPASKFRATEVKMATRGYQKTSQPSPVFSSFRYGHHGRVQWLSDPCAFPRTSRGHPSRC